MPQLKYILKILFRHSGIWNYIEGIRFTVKDMNQRVVKAKENVCKIKSLINKWNEKPLFKRINKPMTEPLLDIDGMVLSRKME